MADFFELLTWTVQLFMVFGGILPYLPQYKTIYSSKNAEGFSTYVCLVLLVANILRIFFWYGKRYELPLLLQSVVMVAVMLAMLHICTAVREPHTPPHRLYELKWFWQWDYFSDYVLCVIIFFAVGACVTLLASGFSLFVEVLGLVSLLTEATLGIPQFIRNYRSGSTKGMSLGMVLLWLAGDSIKTVYFIANASPVQFLICGVIQCIVDVAVLIQVGIY